MVNYIADTFHFGVLCGQYYMYHILLGYIIKNDLFCFQLHGNNNRYK